MISPTLSRYRDARNAIASLRLSEGATRISTDLRAAVRAMDLALAGIITACIDSAEVDPSYIAEVQALTDKIREAAAQDGQDALQLVGRILRLVEPT